MKRMKCKTRRKDLMTCHKNSKNLGPWNFLRLRLFEEKMGGVHHVCCLCCSNVWKWTFFLMPKLDNLENHARKTKILRNLLHFGIKWWVIYQQTLPKFEKWKNFKGNQSFLWFNECKVMWSVKVGKENNFSQSSITYRWGDQCLNMRNSNIFSKFSRY
jgi:hypothetical protein